MVPCDMPLLPQEAERLIDDLAAKGWAVEDGIIYAPHRSMWFVLEHPWRGNLADLHRHMTGRLHRIGGHRWMYTDADEHAGVLRDTATLVEVLEEIAESVRP